MLSRLLTFGAAALVFIAAVGAVSGAHATWPMWALTGAAGAIAALHPAAGLLLAAAFAPLGGAIAALGGVRTSWTEPLALAVLAGWLLRRVAGGPFKDAIATALAVLLALAVLASLIVQCAVAHQVLTLESRSFVQAMLQCLLGEMRVAHPELRPEVAAAVRLLTGCSLFVMAAELCRERAGLAASTIRMVTAGAAGVAALSLVRFIQVAIRQDTDFISALQYLNGFLRVSSTIADLNAAGAMFVLVLPAAAVLTLRDGRRWAWSPALLLVSIGLWLSGSRAAVLGGAVGMIGFFLSQARHRWPWHRTAAVVAALAVGVGALLLSSSRLASHGSGREAWLIREQLAIVGFRMARQAPVFGVGVGRFMTASRGLASAELRQYYAAQNAHNQVIQLLGELGVVGAGLFVALIACSLMPGRVPEERAGAALGSALRFGLIGFVAASLLMHPLLSAEVSAAFWICLGVARSACLPRAAGGRAWRAGRFVPAIAVLGIVLSVPFRVAAIRRDIDLTGVGVGLSAWRTDADDARHFRVAARHAALFVDSRASHVGVPLRARSPGRPAIDVALFLEGRPAGRLRVQSGAWSDLDMPLPPPGGHPRFLRLDLRWSSDARRARLDVGALAYPGDDGS